jgi:diguanylate cyclase (GGDEF)-like protein
MGDYKAGFKFPRTEDLDAVTGLPQRKHLDHDLPEILRQLGPDGLPLSVIMVDIDNFKMFNDKHGHDVGDRVLRHVASLIRASVRYRGDAYRYGGEEITVLLLNTVSSEALCTAERLCDKVGRTPFVIPGCNPLQVTVSLGVASTEVVSGEEILVSADMALLQAKKDGKNRAGIFDSKKKRDGDNVKVDVFYPGHSSISVGGFVNLSRWFAHRNDPLDIEAREMFLPGSGSREITDGGTPRFAMVESEIRGRVVGEVQRHGASTWFVLEVEGDMFDLMVKALAEIEE